MHTSFLSTFLLAGLLTAVASAGIEKRSFTVERVANPGFTGHNGPRALAKVYRKYNMPMPRDLEGALEFQEMQKRSLAAARQHQQARREEAAAAAANKGDFMGSIGGRVSLAGTVQKRGLLENLLGGGQQGKKAAKKGGKRAQAGAAGGAANGATGAGAGARGANGAGNAGNAAQRTTTRRSQQTAGPQAGNQGQQVGEQNGQQEQQGQNQLGQNQQGLNQQGQETTGQRGGQGQQTTGQQGQRQQGQQEQGQQEQGQQTTGQQGQLGQQGQQSRQGQQAQQAAQTNQTGAPQSAGSVPAIPEENDTEFLSPVMIGGQQVNLDFDTGSSDLWVFSTQLPQEAVGQHRLFDPSKSTSFTPMDNAKFLIRYGDGSGAKGNVGTDVVSVGGVSVPQQPVQLATQVTGQFVKDTNNDGLMGLAFSKLNTVKPQAQQTFFDNVRSTLPEPVFTADLRKNATGAYTFGQIDRSKFQGDLAIIPVNTTMGFWQFSSEKFAVGGGPAQPATSGGQAIADTGTTLILADAKVAEGYYSQVQGAKNNQQMGGITVPCDAQLPDLDLDIGGKYMARVAGSDINFAPVGNGECFGGLQAAPPGQMGIFGDIIFKSQFVAFNNKDNTLGMAPHA